jgi:large subunit ribosomal protein L5
MFEKYYRDIICEDLILKENITFKKKHALAHFSVITVNYSSGLLVKNAQFAVPALTGFQLIYGQKPKITKAKKSISGFQVREDQLLGCKVTLRRQRLFFLLEKLVFTILPRLNVIEQKLVCESNYNLGIIIILFPELENHYDSFEFLKGCHLNIVTSSKSDKGSRLLLSSIKVVTKKQIPI